jgi:cell division control protein 6
VTGTSEDQTSDSQRTDDSTTVTEDGSQSETDDVESSDKQMDSPPSDRQDDPSSATRSEPIQSNLSSSIEDSAACDPSGSAARGPSDSDVNSDADSDTDSSSFLDDVPEESSPSERTDAPSELSDDDSDTPSTPTDDQVPSGTEQDRSQSIEDMLLEFDEQEGLIRDRSLLDPNHIVEEDRIVGRDEQLKNVTKMLRVALGNNRPPNLFLYGPSGTGKSLITKAVCKNISRICRSRDIRFGTIEVNCQGLDTLGVAVYELVCCAAEEAGVDVTVPKHGVATKEKWDELFRIVNENFDSVVFVLDELDMLVGRRDKQDPAFSRLLYQLSRAGANDELTAHVSVVAISNDTKMMESVGSRALSSFTPEDVHFDDYDANQLQSILRRRRDAFHGNALDEDVIPLASAFAAQTHGDARKAIDLMRVAGELAERENADRVREEHVRGAQDKVEKNRVLEVVRGISTQKKLCLYATAAVAAETDDGTARSTTGYRVYQFLTDSIEAEQYHQETYVNKMKEMTTYSLVDFERRSHGPRSGMFLEFQFGERPETILETLREDSRLDMVSPDEVTSVVQAQIRNQT